MRKRMIDPAIWGDQKIAKLDYAGRLFWIGLITIANDYGKMRGDVNYLASQIFPYDRKINIKKYVEALIQYGRIITYEAEGETYLKIMNWDRYQRIDHPSKDDIPEPTKEQINEATLIFSRNTPEEDAKNSRKTLAQCSLSKAKDVNIYKTESLDVALKTQDKKYLIKDTPMDHIIHDYKYAKGFALDDREWNAGNYARCKKALTEYEKKGGTLDQERFAKAVWLVKERFGEDWTLETAIRYIPEANKERKTIQYPREAIELATFINKYTGSEYKAQDIAVLIDGLLKTGSTLEDLKSVVAFKVLDWKGTDNEKHLIPTVLFKEQNYRSYLIEAKEKLRKENNLQ